jgi:VanZ family protein
MTAARDRSSAGPLSVAFALLVVYASLYPFTGWRWPPGLSAVNLLALPWPPWRNAFDIASNVLGYLPLGALVYGACVRNGVRIPRAMAFALGAPAVLSFVLEVVQTLLPARVPSRLDWVLNIAGAAVGAALAAAVHRLGGLDLWQAVRDRWLARRTGGAIVLLLLWPIGLLFPAPVPLGVGQVGQRLRDLFVGALEGTPWSDAVAAWAVPAAERAPLSPPAELGAIALGLLAPCLVAFTASRPGWRRVLLALGAVVLAIASTTFSTALNFAPEHAFAWLTPVTLPALATGFALAAVCAPIGRRMAAGLGLVVLTALVALVAQAPSDPYYAESLQAWEQGRFIRFHGLARWIGWLWPYLAMVWLLLNLGARHRGQS